MGAQPSSDMNLLLALEDAYVDGSLSHLRMILEKSFGDVSIFADARALQSLGAVSRACWSLHAATRSHRRKHELARQELLSHLGCVHVSQLKYAAVAITIPQSMSEDSCRLLGVWLRASGPLAAVSSMRIERSALLVEKSVCAELVCGTDEGCGVPWIELEPVRLAALAGCRDHVLALHAEGKLVSLVDGSRVFLKAIARAKAVQNPYEMRSVHIGEACDWAQQLRDKVRRLPDSPVRSILCEMLLTADGSGEPPLADVAYASPIFW